MIVYWAHREGNINLSEGYIGISRGFKGRQQNHISGAKLGKKGHFYSALRKYDDIIWDIVANDLSEEDACTVEKHLRPTENIGWNMSAGGNLPPIVRSQPSKGKPRPGYNNGKKRKSRAKMKVYTTCKQCSKVRLQPFYLQKRQFCSHKCGSLYKKGICYQTPEYINRLKADMLGNRHGCKNG